MSVLRVPIIEKAFGTGSTHGNPAGESWNLPSIGTFDRACQVPEGVHFLTSCLRDGRSHGVDQWNHYPQEKRV